MAIKSINNSRTLIVVVKPMTNLDQANIIDYKKPIHSIILEDFLIFQSHVPSNQKSIFNQDND